MKTAPARIAKARVPKITIRSWASKWTQMSSSQRDALLETAAKVPFLAKHQAVSIIQGHPPDFGTAIANIYVLDDFQVVADRINADVSKGAFQFPCTPAELAAWGANNSVKLAEAFLGGLPKIASVVATTGTKPSKRGRPSKADRNQQMCEMAHEVFDQAVAGDRRIKKREVAEEVGKRFDVSTDRTERIISSAGIDWSRAANAIRETVQGKPPIAVP